METRRAPRVDISLKVISRVAPRTEQKFALSRGDSLEVEAVDISALGLGIFSKCFLPKGLIIELEIDGKPFKLDQAMKIRGEIRYSAFVKGRGYRCGIQFIDTPPEYKKKIEAFVADLERRKDPRYQVSE